MANLLKNLMLEELSLVDRPANAQAMVSLFKRDDSQEDVMNEQEQIEEVEVTEKMDDCPDCTAEKMCATHEAKKSDDEVTEKSEEIAEVVVDVEALKADVDKLRKENEQLRKGLIENGFVIKADAIEKKAEVEMIEVEGEMVSKSDIPAPVLKALEAAKLEKADIELTKRASEALPHFDLNTAKSLVKSFGNDEAIMAALLAADKAFEAAMQEFGKSDVDGEFATAADKLDALVKSYMQDNQFKKSEYAKAYAAVAKTEEGKTLINKSYKGE
jgi:hypothetical protein